jgi:peptidoglycan hydrolase-like protein with peptidoglycan-binding domain
MGTAAHAAAAPSKSKKSSSKATSSKSTSKPASSKSASAKKSTSKSSTKRASSRKRSSGKKTVARRSPSQRTPSLERYREIQQALQAKGYFGGETDGKWGSSSIDALKKFQQDQSLEPTGKINSLSLIALGLGPKYEKSAETSQAPPSQLPQQQN